MIKITLALLLFLTPSLVSASVPEVVSELQADLKESMASYPAADPANLCFQKSVEAWDVASFHIQALATTSPGIARRNMHIKQARIWIALGSLYASFNRNGQAQACEHGPFNAPEQERLL